MNDNDKKADEKRIRELYDAIAKAWQDDITKNGPIQNGDVMMVLTNMITNMIVDTTAPDLIPIVFDMTLRGLCECMAAKAVLVAAKSVEVKDEPKPFVDTIGRTAGTA